MILLARPRAELVAVDADIAYGAAESVAAHELVADLPVGALAPNDPARAVSLADRLDGNAVAMCVWANALGRDSTSTPARDESPAVQKAPRGRLLAARSRAS